VKLPAGILGVTAGPRVQEIDARWLMAYAAALGHTEPEYFDTTSPDGIISHPLFPVCYRVAGGPRPPRPRDVRGDRAAQRACHSLRDWAERIAGRCGRCIAGGALARRLAGSLSWDLSRCGAFFA
jgi:hypothetical protein